MHLPNPHWPLRDPGKYGVLKYEAVLGHDIRSMIYVREDDE